MKNLFFPNLWWVCLLFSLLFPQSVFAFNDLINHQPRSFSLGGIRALGTELQNPGHLSFHDNKELSLSVLNRFQMKKLNSGDIYWKHPNRILDYGLKLSAFGYDDYQIIALQTSFSKKINSKIGAGINLSYFNESSLLEESSNHVLSSGLGIYFSLNEKLNLVFLSENLLCTSSQKLPVSIHSGIQYSPYQNTFFLIEGSYQDKNHFTLSVGFEYFLLERFILRTGFKTNPKTPSFGIGYIFNKWTIEAGFSFHATLGVSSIIGINYEL